MLEQMQVVRNLVSLNNRLRQESGIPLSQEVLDIAYGGNNVHSYYLEHEFRVELAKACEVVDHGYDLGDLNNIEHHNNLAEIPTDPRWKCIEEDGVYFCLDTRTPVWLEERHKARKEHQAEMKRRKVNGLKQVC